MMTIIRQYGPEMSGTAEDEGGFDKSKLVIVAVIALVAIVGISAVFILTSGGDDESNTKCGNDMCEKGETCANCAKDCACEANEACTGGTCTFKEQESECGDGKCSSGETKDNCCSDCGCSGTAKCNTKTQKCETVAAATSCGDGKCDSSENCFDCPKDCKCSSGEYCSTDTKVCTKSECGNGVCETGEYSDNCCDDCGCMSEGCETCNTQTHLCEITQADIDDAEAIEIITKHYTDQGSEVESVTMGDSTCTMGKPSKSANVKLKDRDMPLVVRILESGEVATVPLYA